MPLTRIFSVIVMLGVTAATEETWGQPYPSKTIRIVTSEPGGTADFMSRLVAQGISGPLGQAVIVDNRPGGVIQFETVSKAPPDGYAILNTGSSFYIGPLLQKMPYDPIKDFAPITLVAATPNLLVVHPSLPVKTVKDLIALAKAKPGALNYGSTTIGGPPQLSAESFKFMAGVNIVGVAYRSVNQAVIALISGEVHVMFSSVLSALPQVKAGKMRAVAVTSVQPSPLFPGLPTVTASGLPGYQSGNINGMFAPARTPDAVIKRLNEEMGRLLKRPDIVEKLLNAGGEAAGGSSEEFAATVKAEMTLIGKVIKAAGIRLE